MTSCPGRLRLGSEVLRGRPALPGDWRLGSWPTALTSCPGGLAPDSQSPRGGPAVPGNTRSGPWARGVDQMSRATRAIFRGPVWSTSSPRRLELGSKGPRCRPAPPGDSRSGSRAAGLTSSPGGLGNWSVDPRGRSAHLGDSCSCPMAHGVDQLSQRSRTWLRCPAESIICPRLLWLGYGCQWCQVHSRAARTHVQRPVSLTICPVRLGPGSDGPRGLPAVPVFSGPVPRVGGVDQLSRETPARLG